MYFYKKTTACYRSYKYSLLVTSLVMTEITTGFFKNVNKKRAHENGTISCQYCTAFEVILLFSSVTCNMSLWNTAVDIMSTNTVPQWHKYRVGQKKTGLFLTVNNFFCAWHRKVFHTSNCAVFHREYCVRLHFNKFQYSLCSFNKTTQHQTSHLSEATQHPNTVFDGE